jgi:hydrocephalus-inducing protein
MKKQLTRSLFTVEPAEGELQSNEEKTIIIRFKSDKEIKLKTNKNTSDIVMEIIEGKSGAVVQPYPINVNVNAVFSKYSITPLRNINFGPMQYGE